jgi:hypothetical protein
MKNFILDVYKMLFRRTRDKKLSIILAVSYISMLNMITIYCLCFLTSDMLISSLILKACAFPYIFVCAAGMFVFISTQLLPFKDLSKEKIVRPVLSPLVIYSVVSMLLIFYVKMFQFMLP